ncbi:MAG: hypothetical protein ABIN89_18075 [Chitinophagaceae bacterium]
MNNYKDLATNRKRPHNPTTANNNEQSLQEKTGATAKQIRKAMEQVGFDRDKVEQYLLRNNKHAD